MSLMKSFFVAAKTLSNNGFLQPNESLPPSFDWSIQILMKFPWNWQNWNFNISSALRMIWRWKLWLFCQEMAQKIAWKSVKVGYFIRFYWYFFFICNPGWGWKREIHSYLGLGTHKLRYPSPSQKTAKNRHSAKAGQKYQSDDGTLMATLCDCSTAELESD